MRIEIEKTLVVSTAHITEADAAYLESGLAYRSGLIVTCTESFFLFPLTDDVEYTVVSDDFLKLVAFAKNHEEHFTHLKLDADGPILEGFPTFDW